MKIFKKLTSILVLMAISLTLISCTIESTANNDRALINGVTDNLVITANVSVIASSPLNPMKSAGSGVVFHSKPFLDGFNYYILTNSHVIDGHTTFFVKDSYGESFPATLTCYDPNYDLAVLNFYSNKEYYCPTINPNDPIEGATVIAMGEPLGLLNSVTLGKVTKYAKVEITGETNNSNVTFDVLEHNAPINTGSSGGAILNSSYEICGINYAATRSSDGEFIAGYAIQPTKIIEFLKSNGLIQP